MFLAHGGGPCPQEVAALVALVTALTTLLGHWKCWLPRLWNLVVFYFSRSN